MRDEPASPDHIELADIWRGIVARLRTIVVLSLLAGALTYLVFSLVAPRYMSEVQLALVPKGSASPFTDSRTDAAPDTVTVRMDKEAVNTHVRALMSPDLASEIAATMKLNDNVEFNAALGSPDTLTGLLRLVGLAGLRAGESEQDRVLGAYFRQLEVYAARESRVIGIRFTSINPELAADIPNTLAETYRRQLSQQRGIDTSEARRAIEPKIAELTRDVAAAEAEAERFRGEADIFRGTQNTGLNEQQLADLTAELSRVKAARSEIEAKARSARELMQSGSAEVLPDVQKSPVLQSILQQRVRLERQISELSASLLPGHPRMRQLYADLAGMKRQVTAEVTKLVEGLEKEARVTAAREASVLASIDEIKSRVVSSSSDEVKLRRLDAVAKSKRAELERLQGQYEASRSRLEDAALPVDAQIVSKARVSSLPVFPKKGSYAALASVSMFLVGLAWAGLRSAAGAARTPPRRRARLERPSANRQDGPRPTIRPFEPAVAASRVPLRAATEAAPSAAEPGPTPVAPSPKPRAATPLPRPVAVGERSLYDLPEIVRRIGALKPEQAGVRTIVTGAEDGIEVGAEAVELANLLARTGAGVVVVDWSPSGTGISHEIGARLTPGMNELLRGRAAFEEVVMGLPEGSAHFIASGSDLGQGTTELDPNLINALLDALDETYDHILVVARCQEARELFERIQGRFDAAMMVSAEAMGVPRDDEFLGFEITDILVLHYARSVAARMRADTLGAPRSLSIPA